MRATPRWKEGVWKIGPHSAAWRALRCICALALAAGMSSTAAAQPATRAATLPVEVSEAARINTAMQKAAAYLLNVDPKGTDDLHRAMVLTALLDAAPSLDTPQMIPSSPAMAQRIAGVIAIVPVNIQTAAWQIHALSRLPDRPETHAALERAASLLIKGLKEEKGAKPGASGLAPEDLQLAVWALQTAADQGLEAPADLWKELELTCTPGAAGRKAGGIGAVGGMALREAVVVAVTQLRVFDALHADQRKPGEEDPAIAPTMARVAMLYKPEPVAGDAAFGLADLLLFTGQRRLAGTLWQPELNREMLAALGTDGIAHVTVGGVESPGLTVEATARDLLLLARANAPVALCKFSYDGAWNGRPRDAANITAWLGDAFGRPLRWQIVSVSDDPAAWNMAPILFMTGSKDPAFAPDTLARLRDYAGQGGLILSSPDNRSDEFTSAIVNHWAPAAFDNAFKPRDLPEDHPLFTLWGKLAAPPRLESISNGIRELWVQSHSDLGATWHGRRLMTRDQWTFAANLFLYTTGRENLTPVVPAAAYGGKMTGSLRLASVKYGGNWNPEPQLASALIAQGKRSGLELVVLETAPADLDAKATPVAHLTGTGVLALTDEQVAQLRKYMDDGGMLIVDAAGGNEAFARSFEALVPKLAPGMKLQALPLNHPIYNGAIAGSVKMTAADYRKVTLATQGHLVAPRLRACMDEFGRPRLVYSVDDLTCGILGINTWGVFGYDCPSAKALMRNLLLYAAHDGRTPATGPSIKMDSPARPAALGPQAH